MHAKKTGLWTLALVLLLACTPESPEEEKRAEDAQAKAIAIEARAAYDQGNHQEAIRLYQEALDIERDPYWQFDLGNSYYFLGYYREALDQFDYFSWSGSTFEFRHYALYNAACCHALLGNEESAFSYLDKAIRAGFYDLELLSTDPDLASIRTSPRFDRYFPPRTARNNVTPAFPIKYSQETLIFEELETPDLPEGSYALVASKQAKLFNNATPTVDEEAKALEVVMEIPYLTIIPIVEELKASNPYEIDPFFEFEGDVNTFYRTEYSGQAGLIWGADLSGINSNIKDLVRTRHYYSKDESSPAFYPFNGYKDLSEEVQAELKEHHIAVEMVDAAEYSVGVYNPSDMLALYENRSRVHTHFLTTDIFLHVYHILFSNLLQEVEITQLLPKLQGFTGSLIKLVDAPETQSTLSQANAEDWEFLENYLLVGRALLSMTPALEEYYDQYNDPKTLSSGEIEAILDLYPPVVQEELRLILGAGGSAASPLFGSQTNYSLYKPRGHYTKNQYLEAYFRAMMWFGNRNFDYKPEDLAASRWKESLMLFSVLQNNPDILAQWKELFDPISFLIGVSENITVYDLQKYLNAQTPGEIDSILGNDDVSQQMIQGLLAQKTKEISEYNPLHDLGTGFSPFETPGFRLLGQRFTLDSFIHSLMTKPAIAPPRNVSGLDILASMGNPTARTTLEEDPYAEEILPQIDLAAAGLEQIDQDFWLGSYYNSYLNTINAMSRFGSEQNYFFTKDLQWDKKTMMASLGAWSELRHDTILYVKQFAAEAGGHPRGITTRIEKLPRPIQYIEPNIAFFYALQDSLITLHTILEQYNLMVPAYREKLASFNAILNDTILVVEREITDSPITPEQNEMIDSLPGRLEFVALPKGETWSIYADHEQFQRALIADVFTNPITGEVLEVGTGRPIRIYVALNDGQGGKRIATGYGYSYYEFLQPAGARMTNEQWKALVYDDSVDLSDRMPGWAQEYLER